MIRRLKDYPGNVDALQMVFFLIDLPEDEGESLSILGSILLHQTPLRPVALATVYSHHPWHEFVILTL